MDGDLTDGKVEIKIWGNATPDIPRGHLASSGDCRHILIYLHFISLPFFSYLFTCFQTYLQPVGRSFLIIYFVLLFPSSHTLFLPVLVILFRWSFLVFVARLRRGSSWSASSLPFLIS